MFLTKLQKGGFESLDTRQADSVHTKNIGLMPIDQTNQQLYQFLSYSTDGHISIFEKDLQQSKNHFVAQSGICSALQLQTANSFAFAGLNSEVYLFSLFSGTVIQNFYAHDDQITVLLSRGQWLITGSLDTIIKFWDLNQGAQEVCSFYEHEEGILSGDLHPTDMLLATIDGNGSVLCREVGNTDNLYCQFNPVEDEGCDAPESAFLCFNKQDPNQMFIAVNSSIFIYQTEDVISGYIKVQQK